MAAKITCLCGTCRTCYCREYYRQNYKRPRPKHYNWRKNEISDQELELRLERYFSGLQSSNLTKTI